MYHSRPSKKLPSNKEDVDFKPNEISTLRHILKRQVLSMGAQPFHGFAKEYNEVLSLFRRAMEHGESNSALLIGPRGSGKSALIHSVILTLQKDCQAYNDSVFVRLHGHIHTDDKLALKGIATQLQLENTVGDKVFGSFAENLTFLLQCFREGNREHSKSVIFILDEFDLFCHHHNQTLLYNLFDVAQSAQAPICVLGVTCRNDVTDLLEKRVLSRFSNRQIHLYPHSTESFEEELKGRLQLCNDLLSVSRGCQDSGSLRAEIVSKWNSLIEKLLDNPGVKECLKQMLQSTFCERTLRNFLFQVVSRINVNHTLLSPSDFLEVSKLVRRNPRVAMIEGLSVLELCLLIAMMHQDEIFESAPFNFEMVYNRLLKFEKHSSKITNVERQVVVKAFEHLKSLEFLKPVTTSSQDLKEFQMFHLLLLTDEIRGAVKNYQGLPTEVSQWACSDLI